jgi:hypothetical protein
LNYKTPEVQFETELDEHLISKAFWVEVNGTPLTKKWLLHRLLYKITNHTSAKIIPIKASSYWDSRFELFWTALYEKLQDSRSPEEAWAELHNHCQDGPLIILIHEIDCLQDNETLHQLQSFWVELVNKLALQDKAGVDRQDCIALFMSKSPPLSIFDSPGYSRLSYGLLQVGDVRKWLKCDKTRNLLKTCAGGVSDQDVEKALKLPGRSPPDALEESIEATLDTICRACNFNDARDLEKYWESFGQL